MIMEQTTSGERKGHQPPLSLLGKQAEPAMEEEDLEEGELSDSADETSEINHSLKTSDAASEYSLIPRPTNPAMSYRVPQESLGRPPAQSFRDSPITAGGDNSDTDSDASESLPVAGKRQKLQPNAQERTGVKKKSVWADVLLEQQISSKIKSGGIVAEDDLDTVERGVESYRPSGDSRTVAVDEFNADQKAAPGELWDVNEDGESLDTVKKRTGKKKRKKVKDRLDLNYVDNHRFDAYFDQTMEDGMRPEGDDRAIARFIARHLNEPKITLIERVTRFAGKEKALELYYATMDIEAAGGMTTLRGDTRRTPGGVFLQLLKKDKHITKETIKDIFAIERENQKFAKKVFIKDRQFRKRKYYNRGAETDTQSTAASSTSGGQMDDLDLMAEADIEIGVAT